MREIAIIISDLYLAGDPGGDSPGGARAFSTAAGPALPGLEQVSRFGQKTALEDGWRAWLARSMGRDDLARAAPAAVAAARSPTDSSARGESPEVVSGGTVWFATPIHLIAGLTSLHLDYRGLLSLPADDLTRLGKDFAATFGDTDFHLKPTSTGALLLQSQSSLDALTVDPSRALAHELEASLPAGRDGAILKRLGAEMEMWLHNHPLNEARTRRGELPVSTLWVWGGGPSLAQPAFSDKPTCGDKTTSCAAFGSDPYLVGLCRLNGIPLQPLPERLHDVAEYSGVERVALVAEITALLHANPRWRMFEALAHVDSGFIQPAMAALRRGALDSVLVVINDTQMHIRRHDRLKFWRARPTSGTAALRAFRW